jgi:hypothetical protein
MNEEARVRAEVSRKVGVELGWGGEKKRSVLEAALWETDDLP